MRFSLIIGTLNRHKELDDCVDRLLEQTMKDYEIIIVDQSNDDYSTIKEKKPDKIKYIRIDQKGLSHARNVAIQMATGDYICLVDDDGLYEPNVLEVADSLINKFHPTVLGGKMIDPVTGISRTDEKEAIIKWSTSFRYHVSPTMIIESDFLRTHQFDEDFGVGAKYGSGEETDIVLAALKEKKLVYYSDQYSVKHHVEAGGVTDTVRVKSYSYGRGALLKKTTNQYSRFWGAYLFIRSYLFNFLSGMLLYTNTDERQLKIEKAKAIKEGYVQYGRR